MRSAIATLRLAGHCNEPSKAPLVAFGLFGRHAGDVAHFASRAGFALAVKVEAGAVLLQKLAPFIGVVADKIGHGDASMPARGAERPSRDRAHMLLELGGQCAVQRPVAGVMHSWRDFVDHQAFVGLVDRPPNEKHLHRDHADIIGSL